MGGPGPDPDHKNIFWNKKLNPTRDFFFARQANLYLSADEMADSSPCLSKASQHEGEPKLGP